MISRRNLLLGAPAAAGAAVAKRPNVILILPDRFRGQALGGAGNEQVRMANLDRLAAEGVYSPIHLPIRRSAALPAPSC